MRSNIFITVITAMLLAILLAVSLTSAGSKADKIATSAVESAVVPVNPVDGDPAGDAEQDAVVVTSDPKAGEQIKWQVISGGGSMNGTTTSYKLSGTVGQTAVGTGTYGTDKISHGFWQNFVTGGTGCCDTPGDANNDGSCNIGDAVYLGNYVFKPGSCVTNPPIGCPPVCEAEGDANADGSINIGDQVFINNYIFRPPPASPFPTCGPEK